MHRPNLTAAIGALTFLGLVACGLLTGPPPATSVPPTIAIVSDTPASPSPLAATQSPVPPSATPHSPPPHDIGVRQTAATAEFFHRQTGEKFTPRGANYVFVPYNGASVTELLKVGIYDPERTRRDFGDLADNGYNTVRVFLDHCNAGPGCIGDDDNQGLNPAYVDNIADMLAAAREAGLYILFTSNDLPDQGGYSEQANAQAGPDFAGYRNSYYLTPGAVEATRRYWRDLLTGLNARAAATDRVLGWQLLNEQWMFIDQPPLSLTAGTVETTTGAYDMSDPEQKRRMVSDGLIYYIAQVKEEILTHDPSALVTMGFFAPGAAPGWYIDTAPLLAGADLDFFDFHAYPGRQTLDELTPAFGMDGYNAKPIILGEFGAFRHIYPAITSAGRAVANWQAESCADGFDGWLYWTYYPAGARAGDNTWGLLDESRFLLNLLAPATHPDPCLAVAVPGDNLAYQKPVRASATLPAEPPENAVDENAASSWSAGSDPPQWIEVDLGQAYRLTGIRLLNDSKE